MFDLEALAEAGIRVAIACSRPQLVATYALVHQRYLEKGYVAGSPGSVFYRREFGAATTRAVVASRSGTEIIGAMTVVADVRPQHMHVERLFPEVVVPLRAEGRRLVEVTALSVAPCRDVPRAGVFFALSRFVFQYACWRGYDDILLAVHPRHGKVYERVLHGFPVGEERPYASLGNHPAVCYRIEIARTLRSFDSESYEFFVENRIPEVELARPGMSAADHLYFCQRAGLSPTVDWEADAA